MVQAFLHDEAPTAEWYELLEDFFKVLRDLLEGELDGLILALVEYFDELADRLRRLFELFAALD